MMLFAEKIRIIWSRWEIRMLVLLSLCLQIILTIFGSRRKCVARSWILIFVWSAYLMADWAATVALGNLARNKGDAGDNSPKLSNALHALWAPFLLLHLGGPDNITAYALEDNELWLRHLLGLVVQVGLAFYVFLQFWRNSSLTFVAIPVLISGIIKYGERTFVLRSSSTQRFKDSLYSTGDVSPDLIKRILSGNTSKLLDRGSNLIVAHVLFKRFAYLFAGLLVSYDATTTRWGKISAGEAFSIVQIELGFMYDVLYTKATIVYSTLGIILRCVSFLNSVSALVVFSIMIDIHDYSVIDTSITYLLLVSAVVLEVYAFILHFFSDWTKLCLIQFKSKNRKLDNPTCLLLDFPFFNHKRWSESMGQFNLLSYCLKDMPVAICIGADKLFSINKFLEKYMFLTWEDVSVHLKETIFNHFIKKLSNNEEEMVFCDFETSKAILSMRGNHVIEESYQLGQDFRRFTIKVEFDRSLLIWHLATNICYYDDFNKQGDAHNIHPKCKIAKSLSDYMLYLLVFRPSMMPKEIVELKPVLNPELMFTKTCDKVTTFLKSKRSVISNKTSEACRTLLEIMEKYGEENDHEYSNVLVPGCELAKLLQSLESEDAWNHQRKWEMITDVWVEMLGYAAIHFEWKEHGQQLRKGGELLTHVCLLMTNFGISQQYRFSIDMPDINPWISN